MAHKWTEEEIDMLKTHYPQIGKLACAKLMGMTEAQVRAKAARLGIKQDKTGEFFKDWQKRSAESKVGKKRPAQADVIKGLHKQGKLKKTPEQLAEAGKKISKHWKEFGHPRGALGLKHTDELKKAQSERSKKMWENMSDEVRDEFSKRASITGQKTTMNRMNASWKADWREIGGLRKYYRSRWEANYARYLQWLLENKQIQKWEHEPQTFWFEGIKRGVMSYLPDFRVTENDGSVVFHEVKGWMDDRSKTKIKRMAIYHPDVKLIVIDSKLYKSLEKKAKLFVKDWE
jgi:Protein of unknown function (DUF1064)